MHNWSACYNKQLSIQLNYKVHNEALPGKGLYFNPPLPITLPCFIFSSHAHFYGDLLPFPRHFFICFYSSISPSNFLVLV